jgi:tetratricopeptide (TPR) repeat protein
MTEDGNTYLDDDITAVPPPPAEPAPLDEPDPGPDPTAEVFPPTPAALRVVGKSGAGRARQVMAVLTADALWLQDTWRLRHVPLSDPDGVETRAGGKQLVLTFRPEVCNGELRLTFAGADEGRRCHDELQARRRQVPADAPPPARHVPEGVALVVGEPGPSHVVVGRVEFTGRTARASDRGLQLRAALRGADAVVRVWRHKCFDAGDGNRHVSGVAVRVEDTAERERLRRRWFADEVRGLVKRMLLLLVSQVALLLLVSAFCAGASSLHAATGETPLQALRSSALALGLFYAWPLLLLVLLSVLRRPQLLPAAGLAVLAATTGRGLTVMAAHLLAVRTAGGALTGATSCFLVDPVEWAFAILGLMLSVRAWRLAGDAPNMLPPEEGRAAPTARKAWARGLLALTAVFALALLGFTGTGRYQMSAYLAQPGIDPRREHEALLAFNRGVAFADREELAAAERAFQDSLRQWEELTKGPAVPPAYRAYLGRALYNLAWICHRMGRLDEAESYYARAVAAGEQVTGDPAADDEFQRCLAEARRLVAELRADKLRRLLDEKDELGVRKYEEAQVKAPQEAAEAVGLYAQAITLWEEILPQATAPDYRRFAVARLAAAHLELSDLRQQQGQRREAETALLKAIEYGEQAVALAPNRPLPRHKLELARQMLERQREQDLQEEIGRLYTAERFGDAAEMWSQRIEEQEELLRAGQDREAATRRLAGRLARFAWFLAHCPDGRVRDTKAAVKNARRATELQPDAGDYWYTLAMVQYRGRDWRGSLASLEQLKAREGEFDASDWLLVAMNRHRLKQRDEAREALRKAVEWIDERKRQAEDNAVLRFQYELMRPALESLRREAENLLQGNDPTERGIG